MSRRTTRRTGPSTSSSSSSNKPAGCPCGLPAAYDDCCGKLHRGLAQAATAEQLMRSRYSAFAVRNVPYLMLSWHPDTRPAELDLDPRLDWERLEILGATEGGPFHGAGTVEFRAHYRERGHSGSLHENSRFVRHEGAWVYVDGDLTED
jgi:SEC-C motif-containing protein